MGVAYQTERWLLDANIGLYSPEDIGVATHDEEIQRLVTKVDYAIAKNLHAYCVAIIENDRLRRGVLNRYDPFAFISGIQFVF